MYRSILKSRSSAPNPSTKSRESRDTYPGIPGSRDPGIYPGKNRTRTSYSGLSIVLIFNIRARNRPIVKRSTACRVRTSRGSANLPSDAVSPLTGNQVVTECNSPGTNGWEYKYHEWVGIPRELVPFRSSGAIEIGFDGNCA